MNPSDLPQLLLFIICILGYAGLSYWVYTKKEVNTASLKITPFLMLTSPVLLCHLLFLVSIIDQEEGVNLGLVNIACLMGWLIASLTTFSSSVRPVINLCLFAFPIAASTMAIAYLFPSKTIPLSNLSTTILIHILMSVIAFSVLSIAAGQAVVIAGLDYRLKNNISGFKNFELPSLQTLEASLFEIIALGVILLTFSIISGLIFLDDMFAQHVVHKTILSITAWIVFSALLIGRIKFGWRGSRAIKMALSGYLLLFFAFLGSKFVLEILLERL